MDRCNLDREQAIKIFGQEAINRVENRIVACVIRNAYTGRLMPDHDTRVEFSASVEAKNESGDEVTLTAVYYQENYDLGAVDQLDELEWSIDHFEEY